MYCGKVALQEPTHIKLYQVLTPDTNPAFRDIYRALHNSLPCHGEELKELGNHAGDSAG
jgi:hypothetical protein